MLKFKDIRDVIYDDCTILKDNKFYCNIQTHEKTDFDECEVIGIRTVVINNENVILISCK